MIFFKLIEFAVIVLLIMLVWSQVLVPAITGRKLFPYFRREERLKEELRHAKQVNHENNLENELEKEIYKND